MFARHRGHAPAAILDADTFIFVIDRNAFDLNLREYLGQTFTSAVTVIIRVEAGVIVQALSTGTPAMDLDAGLPSGSVVRLYNNGFILGMGGEAGDGAAIYDQGTGLGTGNNTGPTSGRDGGTALRGPGSGVTFEVTNGAGHIWGGGGGGGGGGATLGGAGTVNGGGGGGGAGGGRGGRGGKSTLGGGNNATDGTPGSSGVDGVNGTGGTGSGTGGTGGNGGAGGDWGAAGSNGTDTSPGSGGAAGLAIDQNGGTATFVSGNGAPNIKGAVT
jgi:hypothetical protein